MTSQDVINVQPQTNGLGVKIGVFLIILGVTLHIIAFVLGNIQKRKR